MTALQPHDCVSTTTTSSPTISTRHGFANRHLMAVEKFTCDLREHEEKHRGEKFGPAFNIAQWLATAAYVLSYSAVEAWVSETLDDFKVSELLWKPNKSKNLLDRCDAVLKILNKSPLDRSSPVFLDMQRLTKIRHGLVHPKAEWSTLGRGSDLSQVVLEAGFELSPFETDKKDAFPLGCMSTSGAQWAHDTAMALISELRRLCA